MWTLVALEVNELPIPAWAFGVIAFAILSALMLFTLAVGKGRPHS